MRNLLHKYLNSGWRRKDYLKKIDIIILYNKRGEFKIKYFVLQLYYFYCSTFVDLRQSTGFFVYQISWQISAFQKLIFMKEVFQANYSDNRFRGP